MKLLAEFLREKAQVRQWERLAVWGVLVLVLFLCLGGDPHAVTRQLVDSAHQRS